MLRGAPNDGGFGKGKFDDRWRRVAWIMARTCAASARLSGRDLVHGAIRLVLVLGAAGLAMGGCREQQSGSCLPATDCQSCTQMDCHFCLEDGMCMPADEACVGEVART